MRMPKFRAWTEEGEVMYYDVYPFQDDALLLSYDEIAFDEVPASDFILMQSTGLKNKKGYEIFEGDIVKYKLEEKTFTDIVTYNKFFAYFGLKDDTGDSICSFDWLLENIKQDDIEVIGNVYENHELLEGE